MGDQLLNTLNDVDTRRIILLGKTGNGKSSTGNSILGHAAFKSDKGLNSVTEYCQVCTGIQRLDRPCYKVCDTPGLLDTDVEFVEQTLEVQSSVEVFPKPHAFLIVLRTDVRMTQDEMFTIDLLRIMFGEDVFKHCIIVFTRGNEYSSDAAFEDFFKGSEILVQLLQRCKGRIVRIENRVDGNGSPVADGISRLFRLIEEVSDNGKLVFTNFWHKSHKQALIDHRASYTGRNDVMSKLNDISKKLTTNKKWKVGLVAAGVVGVTAVGGLGLAGLGQAAVGAIPYIAGGVGKVAGSATMRFAGNVAVGMVTTLKFW